MVLSAYYLILLYKVVVVGYLIEYCRYYFLIFVKGIDNAFVFCGDIGKGAVFILGK
jgi:hypothetical protein